MPNTLGGVNLAVIAQKTLKTLMVEMLPVRAFTTLFSDQVANVGESVTTRVATQPSIQDFTSSPSAATVTTTAKTVTLSNYKGVRIGFTDMEVSKSSIDLVNVFVNPIANTICNSVMDSVFALVDNATFGAAGTTSTSGNFDADDVADAAQVLSTANVPKIGRFMILGPTYFAALAKDAAIQAAYAYGGSEAIRENRIPRVHGFDIYEYNDIPSNSENLTGCYGSSECILIAARTPAVPANFPGEVESATDPDTGLTVQVRRWYSADDRQLYYESGIIYGVAAGVTANLKRIVSS